MKQENTNSMLDALFQQARNAEPVFSEKDMEQLFSQHSTPNEIMHDTQLTSSLTTTGKVIITKGIVMMSTLGLGIASAFTYYLLSSTTPVATERPIASNTTPPKEIAAAAPTISEPLANASSQATYVDDTLKRQRRVVVVKKDGIDPSEAIPVVAIRKAEDPLELEKFKNGLMKNIDVAKVTPIEIDEVQLAKLGIAFNSVGGVSFQQRSEEDSQVTAFTLNPGKSIVQISTSDKAAVSNNVPEFGPRIVTTLDGKKRFIQYSTVNTLNNISKLFPEKAYAKTNVIISQTDDSDSNNKGISALTKEELTNEDGTRKEVRVRQMVRVESNLKSTDSITPIINEQHLKVRVNELNIDSLLRAQGIDPSMAKGKVEVKMMVDNSKTENDFEKGLTNSDGTLNESKVRAMADSVGSILGINFQEMLKSVMHIVENAPDPNTLVPVLIKNKNGLAENNLIFWYEPADISKFITKENANIASLDVKAPSGTISALSVYPNPATSRATIQYNLNDARMVNFAIHNLLGQKIQDVKTMSATSGKGEININVADFEPGLYLLVLSTDKGEQMIKRLVVER